MDPLNPDDYTVVQLKNWLKNLNMKISGNKAELLLRLNEIPIEERGSAPAISDIDHSVSNIVDLGESVEAENERSTEADSIYVKNREIDLLKREKALLERENNFLQNIIGTTTQRIESNNSNSETSQQVPLALIKEIIPTYNGNSNFEFWSVQVKSVRDTYNVDENIMRALIASKLSDKALHWFQTNINFATTKVDTMLHLMNEIFTNNENKLMLRRRFESRKWKIGESFSEYYNSKITLSLGLQIDENEIIDYLIEGIPDENLQNQACLQCFNSKSKLLQAFSKITLKSTPKSAQKSQLKSNEIRCYNCNSLGHYASDCKKAKREYGSCYGCGSKTHMVAACPERKKQIGLLEHNEFVRKINYSFGICSNFFTSLDTLLDTGSPISFIRRSSLPIKSTSYISSDCNGQNYFGLNKTKLEHYGIIDTYVFLQNNEINLKLLVVADKTMTFDVVLGRDFLAKSNFNIAFNCKCLKSIDKCNLLQKNNVSNEREEKKIFNNYEKENFTESNDSCENDKIINDNLCIGNNKILAKNDSVEFEKSLMMIECNIDSKCDIVVGDNISFSEKQILYRIFDKFYVTPQRPDVPFIKHSMKLTLNDNKRFFCPARRLSYSEKEELQKILDEYLKKNIIRPSESEFTSPIVLVKKKTGELRMCVDFRTLNKSTAKDNYPLPLIDDLLDRLENKTIFTKLDLRNGFFHVFMDPESIKYTSFVTPLGQFEFLRMPFGLKNAPAVFQRFINKIFADMIKENKLIIYLDDLMIATKSFEEHIKILNEIFCRLVANNLELRLDKCEFLQSEIKYLGYTVNGEGIRADERGLDAIKNFPIPKKVQSVQSFLGLCSYFRRFVKNFSIIAKPLYDLVKKNVKFEFGAKELECFNLLKNNLLEAPTLALFNPKNETELHCDASSLGYGAILLQKKEDGKFHPIFYFSKRTTEQEAKYHSFELETLAIIYALKRFRIYLQGRQFKIITDCNSLALTLKKKELNPRIARWALDLQNYDYILEHRENQRMQHVDALSRCTNILTIESNTFEENLIICQNKDVKIKSLRESLEMSENSLYEMRNGVIYRKKDDRILFYVPEAMEQQIVYKYHNEMGHVGIDKVVEIILKNYWFPRMKEKITNHIRNCPQCIAHSSKQGHEGSLNSIPKGNTPFEVIHIDHYGPIDNSVKAKKYILLVVDGFTKFVRLYCTKTTKTKEAITALSDYFRSYSRPKTLISDRGTCFTSNDFKMFLEVNNVKHIKIATGSPQANGQVERINRSLGNMIAKVLDSGFEKNWIKSIEVVEFALNNTMHKSVKQHPSVLLFGKNQRGKVVDELKEKLDETNSKNKQVNIEEIRKQAEFYQRRSQEYNEKYTNKKRKEAHQYKIGDYVMVKNFDSHQGAPRKLIPKFKGPYEVKKILRNDRYLLCDVDNFQQSQIPYSGVWAADNMKPWLYVNNVVK